MQGSATSQNHISHINLYTAIPSQAAGARTDVRHQRNNRQLPLMTSLRY
jgi:hypothetical protein